MHSNGISIGGGATPGPSYTRGAYHRRTPKAKDTAKKCCGMLEHISHRTGSYDAKEVGFVNDPYVAGYEWAAAGKTIKTFENNRRRRRSDYEQEIKLFTKGFNDYHKEAKNK